MVLQWARTPLLAAALLIASWPSQAADIPVKAPIMPVKAPIAPVFGWGGFYIGANVGYSWGPWDSTSLSPIFATAANTASPKVNGWLGGAQIGHNWQFDRLVVGIEADYQVTGEKASNEWSARFGPIPFGDRTLTLDTTTNNEWKFPWFATIRGRIGHAADDWLFYATGGAAVGRASFATTTAAVLTITGVGGGTATASLANSEAKTRWGWTLGGGIEKAFGRNFSAKLEYLYLDLGSHTFLAGSGNDTTVKLRDHIVRVGLNYRFTPLMSRY